VRDPLLPFDYVLDIVDRDAKQCVRQQVTVITGSHFT
jgi:hypothetical protein